MALSAERKAALAEGMISKRRALKQRLSRIQEEHDALVAALDQNRAIYEQFIAQLPTKEV